MALFQQPIKSQLDGVRARQEKRGGSVFAVQYFSRCSVGPRVYGVQGKERDGKQIKNSHAQLSGNTDQKQQTGRRRALGSARRVLQRSLAPLHLMSSLLLLSSSHLFVLSLPCLCKKRKQKQHHFLLEIDSTMEGGCFCFQLSCCPSSPPSNAAAT